MPYEPDVDEYAEQLAETDQRWPIQVGNGFHVATVAGSAEDLDTDQMGFYNRVLQETYNGLWEDDYVVVEPFDAPQDQSYLMQLVGLDEQDVWYALDEDGRKQFVTGGAVVHGPDHAGQSYDRWDVDDDIRRRNIEKQGIIPSGRNIRIREFVDPSDLDVDVDELGQAMADELKGQDYTFQT